MSVGYDSRCSCSLCINYWKMESSGQISNSTDSHKLETVHSFPGSLAISQARAKSSSPICQLKMLADLPPVTEDWIRRKISMVAPFPRHIQLKQQTNDTFRIMAKYSHATAESSSDEDEETGSRVFQKKSVAVIKQLLAPEPHKEHDFQRVKFSPALEFIVFPKESDASTSSLMLPINEIEYVSVADSDMSKCTAVDNTDYCFLGVTSAELDRIAEECQKLLPSISSSCDNDSVLELGEDRKPMCRFYLPDDRLTNSVGTLDRIRRDFTRVPRCSSSETDDDRQSQQSEGSSLEKRRARNYFCRAVLIAFLLLAVAFVCGILYYNFFHEH